MKIELKKFKINSLSYESVNNLKNFFGDNPPSTFEVEERKSISSEYSLKNDNSAILVSSGVKLQSVPKKTKDSANKEFDSGIQQISCEMEELFNLKISEDEKEIVENLSTDELIGLMTKKIDIVTEMKCNEFLNFFVNNGPWGRMKNFTITFDVELNQK